MKFLQRESALRIILVLFRIRLLLHADTSFRKWVESMNERLKKTFVIMGIMVAVYISFQYLLPALIPFFIAYLLVLVMNPFVEKLHKKYKIGRGSIACVFLLCVLVVFGVLGRWITLQGIEKLRYIINHIGEYEQSLSLTLEKCLGGVTRIFGFNTESARLFMEEQIKTGMSQIHQNLLSFFLFRTWGVAKGILQIVATILVTFVSVILLQKDFYQIKERVSTLGHFHLLRRCWSILREVGKSGWLYLKAQSMILGIVSALCAIGLLIAGNRHGILFGILIGFLDALPVFGTGTVFLPWSLLKILQGEYGQGGIYIGIWMITWLTREFLEPKLIGKKLGVYPIVIIMTIYIGVHVYGIGGIILGPLSLLVVVESIKELGKD